MKRLFKKSKGLVKGTSSAVLLSAVIHFILLAIAGGLVVFTVIKKDEKKFVPPPPVERPKMELKKPQVKVKKTSAPTAARHIVSKNVQVMTDIQLPDVSGIAGGGVGSGLSGFDLVPDVSDLSLFGGEKSTAVGNDFEGTFYVLNWGRTGEDKGFDHVAAMNKVTEFIKNDWSPYVFADCYRSPKKLYATQFLVPWTPSPYGPRAFGVKDNPDKSFPEWVMHYKGKMASKKGGTYRFWGCAGEVLFVRVNGKLVLNGSYYLWQRDLYDWKPTAEENLKYVLGSQYGAVGFWFTLKPGETVDVEVLTGDLYPPHFGVYLVIEDKAESAFYSRRKLDDGPILPVFRTAEMSERTKDAIKYNLFKDDVDLDGGEIFNAY